MWVNKNSSEESQQDESVVLSEPWVRKNIKYVVGDIELIITINAETITVKNAGTQLLDSDSNLKRWVNIYGTTKTGEEAENHNYVPLIDGVTLSNFAEQIVQAINDNN